MCSKFEAGEILVVILCNGYIKNEIYAANIKTHFHKCKQITGLDHIKNYVNNLYSKQYNHAIYK
ncbi:hypothetical protein B7R74_15190 [Yersinia pseudotuberculosis]|nr:hypothetical protein B7R74_15190 [Yersinia pseudotuberculosis]